MCINELVRCQVGERKVAGIDNTLNGLKKMSEEEANKAKEVMKTMGWDIIASTGSTGSSGSMGPMQIEDRGSADACVRSFIFAS